MQWKPNVTVAAIAEDNGRYLLVEEDVDNLIVFNQPAGHLEKNETLLDAVKREVMEETAREFEPQSLVGVYLYPNPHRDIMYLRFCFAGRCIQHHADEPLDDGIIRAVWMTRDEIEAHHEKMRSPMVRRCIDDYLAGKHYPLEMLNHFDRD
ncbi:MAG TPA: NUDIX hydrolase [Gammaproteobacteria bacterium]|nr:NUDIX hydrolase [Gammaproteobacteria bacterium]